MTIPFIALLALVATQDRPPNLRDSGSVVVHRAAWVMGTELRLALVAQDERRGQEAAEAAFAAVRQLDDILSTWRDDTELQRLNRAPPGEVVRVSPALGALLSQVWRWWRETGGTFDPGVGPLVDVWGVRGTLRQPTEDELARALGNSGLRQFEFDPTRRNIVRRSAGAWLDSGGFGKGAALRSVQAVLRASGIHAALVDFGGQGLAVGSSPEAPPSGGWTIGVAHPAERLVPVRELVIRDRSVSTSGQSERPGHVLDPRWGRPVPAWGSVTVVAQDPLVADILSTALFVMGLDDGLRWVSGRNDVGALFLILRDGRVEARWNQAMEPFLKEKR
ncbi:MAG: FAD:protein FMN transferase [Gemmatimonadetes bacterium]|nr:FAD:protein FMN transferase [Gemmatimonadota bacterium]